jgi:Rad3-related DNA helicase
MDPPTNFHHPFTPYQIQTDFMKALYVTLESKSVGIFESPTGTVSSRVQLIPGQESEFDLWRVDVAQRS